MEEKVEEPPKEEKKEEVPFELTETYELIQDFLRRGNNST